MTTSLLSLSCLSSFDRHLPTSALNCVGLLRCPFGVMSDAPHVGKVRSRDPPWYPDAILIDVVAANKDQNLRLKRTQSEEQ